MGAVEDLLGGATWRLRAGLVDGRPVALAGREATLALLPGEGPAVRVGGRAGCNSYGARLVVGGDAFRVGADVVTTRMLCEPAAMALERAFLAALVRVDRAAREDADLVLHGDGVELRFAAAG